jgi:hypothetical protein
MSALLLGEKTLVVIEIHPSQSESELFAVVRSYSDQMDAMEASGEEYRAPVLIVDGFNDDPRDLWHIPEAIEFLKRACRAGFLSILEPSVMMKSKGRCGFVPTFGALELWLVANNLISVDAGEVEIQGNDVQRFFRRVLWNENRRLRKRIDRWRSSKRWNGGAI